MKSLIKTFHHVYKDLLTVLVLAVFIVINCLLYVGVTNNPMKKEVTSELTVATPEINDIKSTGIMKNKEHLYLKLIKRVGPTEAQEALYKSGLPFDGETHLLNHTVGDWLYKEYGTDGLTQCKEYFLSSCYHGFVLGAVAEQGFSVLNKVMDTCWNISFPTATQCAHAIGHGMLAYEGYKNLPKALSDCDEISQKSANFPVYNCYDGIFMENLQAVHQGGKPSPDRWLKTDDLIYPCNDPQIDEKYRKACWSNQPIWIYRQSGRDVSKAGNACLKLENEEYQATCFDAIARQIHPSSFGNIDTLFSMCEQMPTDDWEHKCLISNVRSSFSVGDHELPFTICSRIQQDTKHACYFALREIMTVYIPEEDERKRLCHKILESGWRKSCEYNSVPPFLTN